MGWGKPYTLIALAVKIRYSHAKDTPCPKHGAWHTPAMSTDATQTHKGSPTTAEVKDEPSNVPDISKDKKFHLLSNSKRRSVIAILLQHESLSKRELGELVAARELNRPVEEIPSKEKQRIKIHLHQTHLDQLLDVGVISKRNKTFHANALTRSFEQYVDLSENP